MLDEIAVFLQLVVSKSFADTAKRMKLSNATVTRRIFSLEEGLGVRLLRRNTRHFSLTQEGWYCYERWKNILDAVDEVKDNIANSKAQLKGEINLSVSVYSGFFELVPIISGFLKKYPKIKINFVKSNIFPEILDESFDVFIRYQELNTRVFQSKPLKTYELVTAATSEYLLENGIPKKPADLEKHNCIIHRINAYEGELWHYQIANKVVPVRIDGNFILNNTGLVLEALLSGVGIARLPRYLIEAHLHSGKVVEVLKRFTPPPLTSYLIFPRGEYLTGKVFAFAEYMLSAYS